ncbi:hypothetical protein KGA66_05270 [Actinocrinis puniceicyclus]|uniref:Transglycosylase SLT domain-containing protein n=1 Tax=Actinocrinis puniceicyclus TaxID=977794 RepID=A0A8J7WN13_9ACTN|nr:hypothetical protein [Actinocrinis puniceicyclus]MBS2962445.1 hypothetical protein [Actinocrinis puniceicyclus]
MSRLRLSIPESITAHKHKIAVAAASCTAVTGAVVGVIATGTPSADAAIAPAAHTVSRSVAHRAVPVVVTPSTTVTASSAPTSAKPSPPAAPHAAAPTTTKPPAAAPAVKHVDPYAGLTAYQIAERIVPSSQFGCFDWIVTHESGWSVTATNQSSGAYGLGQALPGDKMASEGADWRTDPVTQIKWTLHYMDGRYGSPCAAQSFWEAHNWY